MEDKNKNLYKPNEIEAKWQEKWESDRLYSPDTDKSADPYFNLMMFPYPSAEGLHVGNMYAFTGADVYARYNRMLGRDVFEPIGLDGFGIHSENYALKVGIHPKEQADISEKNFYRQLRAIGNSFDWQRTVETYNPNYYRWTQWLFIQLFKAGLTYRDTALVNWCPKDLTVLSDEQVIDGKCERCGSLVEKRELEQWFFRITKYAERLLNNIEDLRWTEKVKIAQRNWIGKSEGAVVGFWVEASGLNYKLDVFTTRPDTLFGATFMVLSPEHEIAKKLVEGSLDIEESIRDEIRKYIDEAKKKTEIERTDEGKEKTGVFSGLYAINPVNNEKIPVWIADYVLSGYGTGAIMAVPAHDERDFAFAKKYGLDILQVIEPTDSTDANALADKLAASHPIEEAYVGPGRLINSGEWDGIEVPKDMSKVLDSLEQKGLGTKKANYHLRDWLISRQRYWGPPIPIIYCRKCWENSEDRSQKSELKYGLDYTVIEGLEHMIYAVPEADLPVLLPDVEDWKPMGTGKSPLANHPEFYNTKCPNCGSDAKRETDVSDTFLDSAWYFLRYPSTDIEKAPFDTERTKKWLPVDQYIGGAEHSVLHLLYSRFVTMVLHDLNFIDFDEPFTNFFAHGLIIKDGAKMSKSKGNVVVPDEYIGKYGADTLRAYLMFIGPYSDGGDFRDSGIEGMHRFLRRVWNLHQKTISNSQFSNSNEIPNPEIQKLESKMHQTIKDVTQDIQSFKYNTAIARLMEYHNSLSDFYSKFKILDSKFCESFLLLLAPFAPHMTEELWQRSFAGPAAPHPQPQSSDSLWAGPGGPPVASPAIFKSIHKEKWPEFDERYLVTETVIIPVQINGKRRGEIEVASSDLNNKESVEALAKEAVSKHLEGIEVKKTVYIPGKIVNFVI